MKQVIVARTDLDLSPGKLAVQVAHASVNATESAREATPEWYEEWMNGEYTKIALAGEDESHLRRLHAQAEDASLPTSLVSDAGHTEVEPGTTTVLAVGPAPDKTVDSITGALSLYPV